MCEHDNRTLSKTTKLRLPTRGGLGLIPFEPWNGSFAVRTQLTQQLEQIALICAAWQQAPKGHLLKWTMWS